MEHSQNIKKIVLAYSGGLDTSAMLHWLKKQYGCPVIAFVADVGQEEDFDAIQNKAVATGADEVVIANLKEEFVREFVFPAIQAHAVYEGEYLLGTALARPPIAREQARIAESMQADAVAHGATGKGNDQVRFELTYQALAPKLVTIAPWRTWQYKSRTDLIQYCKSEGIPVESTLEKPYSIDQNLMHCSYEGGVLEDPWQPPPDDLFLMTQNPHQSTEDAEEVQIEFFQGIPIKVDGKLLSPVHLLEELNTRAGRHGIGRVDIVESRFVGMKSRGVYETPGATILHKAHRALESIVLDREVLFYKDCLAPNLAQKIYYGLWFAPETQVLLKTIEETQQRVSGEVEVSLYKGTCSIRRRRSKHSLYSAEYATFEEDSVYRQSDASGFIRLQGLRLRMASDHNKK
jgi:argininosuccinate synthase